MTVHLCEKWLVIRHQTLMIVNVVSHDVMERVVPGKPCSLRAEGSLIQLRHSKPYLSMGAVFAVFAAFYY
jgi:hypothetical protein